MLHYISLALAQIFATILVIDFQIQFLPEMLRFTLVFCGSVTSIITMIRIFNDDNVSSNVLNMFLLTCLNIIIISITCLLEPNIIIPISIVLWILLVLNGIIIVSLFVQKHKTDNENRMCETDIKYSEHTTISRDFYGWVALTQSVFYLAIANYFIDFLPIRLNGMLETFCMMVPLSYLMNVKWNKKILGIENKLIKGKKYVSKKILPWMLVINVLLLIVGYVIFFIDNKECEFVFLTYLISLVINSIFTIMTFEGKFEEKEPQKN